MDPHAVIYAIDLFGTASFAFSGALRAMDRRPDFVGMLILAGATAIGGSTLRDVVLNRDVMILQDWGYPLVILASVIVTFFFPASVCRRESVFKYFDAVGIGVFSAITASVTWQTPGINPLSVLFIATFTGCAGGVIRDVLINKPSLVLENELYVTPVIVGAAGLMAVRWLGAGELAGFATAMLLATGIRIVAILRNWRLPRILNTRAGDPAIHQPAPSRQSAEEPFGASPAT
ncbi:MAG: trimeric intracellular cation channel family protein [Pirellulales bacterium]